MPILPAEPDCNPPTLWDDPSIHASNGETVWWCLHTKPRQEKATARDLKAQGLVYYLPQVLKESHTPKGRKIQSIVPLFMGYMFLKGDQEARLAALRLTVWSMCSRSWIRRRSHATSSRFTRC